MIVIIWQDFYLSTVIGRIGATPLVVISPFLICFEVYTGFKNKKWFDIGGDVSKLFISVLSLFLMVSAIYIIYFLIKGELSFLGENIIVKTIKQSVYYVFIIMLIRNLDYTLNKINSKEILSTLSFYIVLILFVVLLVELQEINKHWVWPEKPRAWSFLHSDLHDYYWRIRLLTAESSFTGPMIMFFSILALVFTKSKIRYFVVISFFMLYLVNTDSKGFLMSLLLSFILFILFKIKPQYLLYGIISVAIIFIFFVVPHLSVVKIQAYSASLMTRYTGIIAGLYSVFIHPIGTGGLNYVYTLSYLDEVSHYTGIILGDFANTKEIEGYVESGSDKNIDIKSTLGHWAITLGVFGIALYTYMCYKLVRFNRRNSFLLFGSFFFIFMTIFVIPLEMEYPSIMFLVVSQFIYFKNKRELIYES